MRATLFFVSMLTLPATAQLLFDAPKLWLVSTFLLSAACRIALEFTKFKRLVIFSVFVIQFVNSAYFFSYFLQGEGFNSRFFYHLRLDLLMGGVAEFSGVIAGLVGLIGLSMATLISRVKLSFFLRGRCQYKASCRFVGAAFGALGLIFYSPVSDSFSYAYKVYGASKKSARQMEIADNILKKPQIEILGANHPKNIILLFLESVDDSFYDAEYYPNLLPELSEIRKKSVDFTNVKQVDAASWTIAGMFASLCALPLHSPFSEGRNTLSLNDNFMSGASCLTDLLVEKGYVAHYVGGANTSFAGKKSFLRSHGFESIKGLSELKRLLKNKRYKHGWGLYDDAMYDFAWQEFEKLSQSESPFVLTMLTLDTHHPKGHASKSCKPYKERGEDNTMLNALHCADQLASQFIRDVRKSEYSEDTAIVVMSDHLAMRNAIWDRIKKYDKERKISFFINLPNGEQKSFNHLGTQYDIAPTILATTGIAKITKPFPFGSSLNEGPGFLFEQDIDINIGSESLVRQRTLSLWDRKIGNLKGGFELGRDGNLLRIKDKVVSLKSDGWDGRAASLIEVNAITGEIEDVKIWPQHAGLEKRALVDTILENPEKIYLAIAKYEFLKGLDIDASEKFDDKSRVYFFGASGSNGNFIETVPKRRWERIDSRAVSRKFELAKNVDPGVRNAYLKAVLGEDVAALRVALEGFASNAVGVESYDLQSCTFNSCDSYTNINGKKEALKRGLNIFGVSKAGSVRNLANIDGCASGAFEDKDGFKKIRDDYRYFDTWILVSHDTVGCLESIARLGSWSDAAVLPKLPQVEFREPYVALFNSKSGAAIEILGNGDKKIHLRGPQAVVR